MGGRDKSLGEFELMRNLRRNKRRGTEKKKFESEKYNRKEGLKGISFCLVA